MTTSNSFNRRRFLKATLIAGAAPLILPGSIWAAETKPNSKINLGIIGLGRMGSGLLHSVLPRNDVRVLAISDVDATRLNLAKAAVQKAYGKDAPAGAGDACAVYNDFREVLARKDIDAVVIATPDHWHALISIAAANAGKDVYCEKPMAHTILEGRAMVKAVRANKRILQVGSMQRSMGEFRAACELIRNGVIGTVAKVDVAIGGGPPVVCNLPAEPMEPGLDWDLWQGPAPARPYNSALSPRGMLTGGNWGQWRHYREYGSGFVGDWGAHHFDIIQWAFGYDDGGPVEFFPVADKNAQSGVRWRYANGTEVTHQPGNGITFYGDKGEIYVNRGKFQLWLGDQLKSEVMDDYSPLLKELLPANAVRLYRSTNQMNDWVKCMGTRKLPVCDVEIGQRSATVCNLVNQVYFHQKVIKWNPEKECFVDGTGEASWLTREYRAPWKLA
jgi:predicted dehydrogenase